MPYKLLAADLDGTLMGDDAIVSHRVRAAIGRAIGKGVKVTLATGRAFRAIKRFAEELGTNAPLICYQGGLVVDPWSGEVVYQAAVPPPAAREMVRFAQNRGLHLNVYLDDRTYVEEITPEAEFYAQISGVPVHPVGNLLAFLDGDPTKLVMISQEATIDRLFPELRERFAGRLQILRSYRTFVEGIPLGVSKGWALDRLAKHLGIAQGETMAIGDSENDADMIAWAHLGVAMAGASPAVRAVADYVAPSVEEDGAAEAIERFILFD